jgi:type IV pilus assembly protein PilA
MRKCVSPAGPRGFTLIELMIVVAIVGILAVLAVYGVRKYIASAKTTEARNSVGQIAKDSAAAFERESMQGAVLSPGSTAAMSRQLCASMSQPIPQNAVQVRGAKYQSSPAEWSADAPGNSGFACLKFSMDQPQYYQYYYMAGYQMTFDGTGPPTFASSGSLGAAGAAFMTAAAGDLDGDGQQGVFALMGTVNANLALNIAPNLWESNPEE